MLSAAGARIFGAGGRIQPSVCLVEARSPLCEDDIQKVLDDARATHLLFLHSARWRKWTFRWPPSLKFHTIVVVAPLLCSTAVAQLARNQ